MVRQPENAHRGWTLLSVLNSKAFTTIAALCCLASCAAFVNELIRSTPSPSAMAITRRDGSPLVRLAATNGPFAVPLSDGSSIWLAADAVLEPLASTDRATVVLLIRGRASFDVICSTDRRWLIEAGVASIETVSVEARFTVERSKGLTIRVDHGAVLVRGSSVPDHIARVNSGESLHLD